MFDELSAFSVFTFFPDIKTLYRTMVAHYTGVDDTFGTFVVYFFQDVITMHFLLPFGQFVHNCGSALHHTADKTHVRR